MSETEKKKGSRVTEGIRKTIRDQSGILSGRSEKMVFRRLDGNTFKNRAKKYGWRKGSVDVKYRHIRILPSIGKKKKYPE
ncbi:hypothetical protein LEP1GSC165_4025 [Leptospira santarosai str. CBC523]|nr:hypothetical protein LEP1GSC165_4025 [Leptospira santarosai str. CBC523]